jgi:uncharacterized protein YwqG
MNRLNCRQRGAKRQPGRLDHSADRKNQRMIFNGETAGNLFFVIHKSDLANKDFRKVFVTLETS